MSNNQCASTVVVTKACIDGMVSYHLVNYNSIGKALGICTQLLLDNKIKCLQSVALRKNIYPD